MLHGIGKNTSLKLYSLWLSEAQDGGNTKNLPSRKPSVQPKSKLKKMLSKLLVVDSKPNNKLKETPQEDLPQADLLSWTTLMMTMVHLPESKSK
jgi:hypothetical protein